MRFKKGDLVTYSNGYTKYINKPSKYEKFFDENYFNRIYNLQIIRIKRYFKFFGFSVLKTVWEKKDEI